MAVYIIIFVHVFILVLGIYWGRRSIKGDTDVVERDYRKLTKIQL